jgi:hypothetical protein
MSREFINIERACSTAMYPNVDQIQRISTRCMTVSSTNNTETHSTRSIESYEYRWGSFISTYRTIYPVHMCSLSAKQEQ